LNFLEEFLELLECYIKIKEIVPVQFHLYEKPLLLQGKGLLQLPLKKTLIRKPKCQRMKESS